MWVFVRIKDEAFLEERGVSVTLSGLHTQPECHFPKHRSPQASQVAQAQDREPPLATTAPPGGRALPGRLPPGPQPGWAAQALPVPWSQSRAGASLERSVPCCLGEGRALSHCPSPAQPATRSVCQEAGQVAFSLAVRRRPMPSIRCVSTRRAGGRCGWQGAVARRVPESPCPCLPSEAALQRCQPQQQHRQQLRAQQQQRPELWRRQQRQQHLQLRLHAGRGGCPHGGHRHPQPVHALPRDAAEPARQAAGPVRGAGMPPGGAGGRALSLSILSRRATPLCGARLDQRVVRTWPGL